MIDQTSVDCTGSPITNRFYAMTGDLDFRGDWAPQIRQFCGSFDGRNRTILNAQLRADPSASSYTGLGLFRNNIGRIANLRLYQVHVAFSPTTTYDSVGALVGINTGIVENITSAGGVHVTRTEPTVVSRAVAVGGLIGSQRGGRVSQISGPFRVVVKKCNTVGGLIGHVGDHSQVSQINIQTEVSSTEDGGATGGVIGSAIGTLTPVTRLSISNIQTTSSGSLWGAYGGGTTGGIIGQAAGATLQSLQSRTSVVGLGPAGGVVGWLSSGAVLSRSTFEASHGIVVLGSRIVGGIVGYADGVQIQDSNFPAGSRAALDRSLAPPSPYLTMGAVAGGIVGRGQNVILTRVHSAGSVSNARGTEAVSGVGGLAGFFTGSITLSSSKSTISGGGAVGGLIGEGSVRITDSFARGMASCTSGPSPAYIGGLIGSLVSAPAALTRAYSAVAIPSSHVCHPPQGAVGRTFVSGTTVTSTYFDSATLRTRTDTVGVPYRTPTQMYSSGTYVGWDFTNTWVPPREGVYPEFRVSMPTLSFPVTEPTHSPLPVFEPVFSPVPFPTPIPRYY